MKMMVRSPANLKYLNANENMQHAERLRKENLQKSEFHLQDWRV